MAKRHKSGRGRYKSRKFKLKNKTVYTMFAGLFLASAGIVFLSFIQPEGQLSRVNVLLYEQVGFGMYLVPFCLAAIALLLMRSRTYLSKPNMTVGMVIAFLSFVAVGRQGVLGQELWYRTADLISSAGALFIYTVTFALGTVVLFNMSFGQVVNGFAAVFEILVGAFRSEDKEIKIRNDQKETEKEEKKPLFGWGTKPMQVKGGGVPTRPPPVPGPVVKQPPKITTILGTELIVNQPKSAGTAVWEYPPLSLLESGPRDKADRGDLKKNAQIIERTLDSFGIAARVVEVNLGPAVTQYALEIALGTKLSKITALANDLALALAAPTGQIRIEAPIPGRSLVGIEIPNRSLEFVTLKQMLQSDVMRGSKSKLTVSLGLDVSGSPLVANLSKMPHVLIAGTTGSGKSVLINALICSLLYRATPEEVKIILVDPKRVELVGYNGIPHLLTPVIVDTDKILSALKWAMQEMDRRYKQFAEVGVRNIDSFNELSGFQALPYIVIFVDELADLMAYAPVEVEDAICRIAQMARATGIHLVIATQRPSVDVITGLIKANIPSRIAFNVSSMIDSRVIIDTPGAEKLLGRGDMLYIPPDQAKPSRIQGTFVSEREVQKLVEFLKSKNAPVQYTEEVTSLPVTAWKKSGMGGTTGEDGKDALFEEAVRTVCQYDRASASLLQRRLSIGYARAARILDQLEQAGIVGPGEGSKPRDVLVRNADEYFAQLAQGQSQSSTSQPL